MKNIWMTSVVSSEDDVKKVISMMKTYGIDVFGNFWQDDLEKMAWTGAREELLKPEIAMWIILASNEKINSPSIRFGLSLLAMTVQASKGQSFPIVLLTADAEAASPDLLPTILKGAVIQSLDDPALGAKLVAMIHTKAKEDKAEYRLDVYANEHIGQWFEVGPLNSKWSGAMFGIDEGEITFHGVGPKGSLPNESVLNFSSKGIKLQLGEKEYTAWSVQNEIDDNMSYFVQVKGYPGSIIFGPHPSSEEVEVFVVKMK